LGTVAAFIMLLPNWLPPKNHRTFDQLAVWTPVSLFWTAAIVLVASFWATLQEADYDLLRVDPRVVVIAVLAAGIWQAWRDGRSALWRIGLLLWTGMTGVWLVIASNVWDAVAWTWDEGLTRESEWRLIGALLLVLVTIRGSAYLYALVITEWRLNSLTGERHRVLARSHGQIVLDHRSWEQRRNEELIERRERRKVLLPQAIVILGCAVAILYACTHFGELGIVFSIVTALGSLSIANFMAGLAWSPLLTEFLYQTGYQGMKGAKVFDRRPKPKTQPFGAPPASAPLDGEDEHAGSRTG